MNAAAAFARGGMRKVVLSQGADLNGFRRASRALVHEGVEPGLVQWGAGEAGLFDAPAQSGEAPPLILPRAFAPLAKQVVCHSDPERFARLYTLVWRIVQGERALLDTPSDPLVHRLEQMAKSVRRDIHKMHAFVRFRALETEGGRERFIAWFEPDHFIVEAVAEFFVKRFPAMDWAILTPRGSLAWDGKEVAIGPPATRPALPEMDGFEAGWLGYYESTFNPARANPSMMRAEMPRKYWANLPEAATIPGLLQSAPARTREMLEREAQAPRRKDPTKAVAAMGQQAPQSLESLNALIAATPPFVSGGTRAVLGEGPIGATLALVGEQPGDEEDVQGRPFVGPAGRLLMELMAEAGLSREKVYLSNAVKHFKFERRGKKRLHRTPTAGEVSHYRWWLNKELDFVQPLLVVTLGATAALALGGKAISITQMRGLRQLGGRNAFVTTHPSYILRLPDRAAQMEARARLVQDLAEAGALARTMAAA